MESYVKMIKDIHLVLKNGFRELKKSLDGIENALLNGKNDENMCDFISGWKILDSSIDSYPDENDGWVLAKIADKDNIIVDIPCVIKYDRNQNKWELPNYLSVLDSDFYVVGWKRIK